MASPELLRERSILIAFTTRRGGVSPAPYDTLNLAAHVDEDQNNVLANRLRLTAALELDATRLTTAQQTHSRNIALVDQANNGAGATDYDSAIPDTDALVTGLQNTPIAVFTADCVPVILVDPVTRYTSVVHAGYKGLYSRIVTAAIDVLVADSGGRVGDIIAFVGPAIGKCCYDVDPERAALFAPARTERRGGKIYLDTPGIAADEIQAAGIPAENISVSGLCTACREDLFFSYRRAKVCGRQATIAAIL